MSVNTIFAPYPLFTDDDGDPLEAGYLFVGVSGENAETSPIEVYWDDGLTQPAAQPIRTLNGYPARNGKPSALYTNGAYSIVVRDRNKALVFADDTAGFRIIVAVEREFLDVATLLADTTTGYPDGTILRTRTEGFSYRVVATDEDLTTAGGTKLRVLFDNGTLKSGAFNPTSDGTTDATSAFNAMVAAVNRSTLSAVVLEVSGSFYLPAGVTTAIAKSNVTIRQYGATFKIDAGALWTFGDRAGQYADGGVYGGRISGVDGDNSTRIVKVQGYAGVHLVDVNPDRVAGLITLGHDATYRGQGAIVQSIRGSTLDIDGARCIECAFGGGLIASDIQISSVTAAGAVAPIPNDRTDLTTQNDTVGIWFNPASFWDTAALSGVIMGHYNIGCQMKPNTSIGHVNIKFVDCFWDYSGTHGLDMAPSGGVCHNVTFTSCWFVGVDSHAVNIAGSGGLRIIRFIGCEGRQAGQNNWHIVNTGMDTVELIGCYGMGANRLSSNTDSDQDDLFIGAAGVSVQGGRFGQDGQPFTGITGNQARYGVTLAAGLNNIQIESVLSGGTTGGYQVSAYTTGGTGVSLRNNRTRGINAPEYAIVAALSPVPSSGVLQQWRGPFDAEMHINNGTVTRIDHKGAQVSSVTNRTITLRPGDTWSVTYSLAPSITINRLS